MLTVLIDRPVPLVLLALGVFYLSVYVRRCRETNPINQAQSQPSLTGVVEA